MLQQQQSSASIIQSIHSFIIVVVLKKLGAYNETEILIYVWMT